MALSQEDKNEIEIVVNKRIAEMMDGLLDEFGRFVDDVPARQLLEAIKHRSEKEAARLKAQTAHVGLPLA
jgi:hypothetical protein